MAHSDSEKEEPRHTEHLTGSSQTSPPHHVPEYDQKSERKLIRKIDARLLPILGALYSIALIDRVNVCLATAE